MIEWRELRGGGRLAYHSSFLDALEAADLMRELLASVPWAQERGRFGPMPRLTAWYADDGATYFYSGVTHVGLPWTEPLRQLRSRLERECESTFNSVLLNRYRDGRDSMGWHADDEPELGVNPVIASVSLGATRRFKLKHPASGEGIDLNLSDGSLLIMAGSCQHHWRHALPKTAKPVGERINLTFRRIV